MKHFLFFVSFTLCCSQMVAASGNREPVFNADTGNAFFQEGAAPVYAAENPLPYGNNAQNIFFPAAASICLVLTLLFLVWFLLEWADKANFFYALFSLSCGLYFITALLSRYPIIWAYRAKILVLFLIPPVFVFFLETFVAGKIRRGALVYFVVSLAAAVIQIPLAVSFNSDMLRLWLAVTVLAVLPVDLFIPLGREIKAAWTGENRGPYILNSLFALPAGNLVLAAVFLLAGFGAVTILSGVFFLEAGCFIFIVMAALALVHANIIAARKIKNANSEQASYLDLILKNSPDMFILFDSEYRIVNCTATFLEKLPGYTLDDLTNKDYRIIFKTFLDDAVLENLSVMFRNALLQKKIISIFETIKFSGDSARHYEIHFTPMFEKTGNLEGALLFFSDMTDVLAAIQKADQANRAKSSFLATMSHEIRTMLNVILGLVEIQLMNQLPDKTRIDLEKIYLSGSNLLQIINDILDISKIETGKFSVDPNDYNLAEVINDSVQFNIIRIAEKPIRFSIEINENIPVHLFGDEIRIKQVMNNLLSNAFKYTKRGNVTLIIDYEKRDDKNIVILLSVKDTGIGIKQENIAMLFGDYIRFDHAANRLIEGTGLGLSITKKLLNMMDGEITAESEYGKGSTFTVRLPQGVVNDAPLGGETAEKLKSLHYFGKKQKKSLVRKNFTGKKLLAVDDTPINIDVAKGLISLYGIEVHGASSGKTAIELIRSPEHRYDIIVMDHMMPEMSGVDTVRIIRSQIDSDYARTVPIIAFTANALPENIEMFLANGFSGYLTKPVDVYELDKVLNKFLAGDSAEEGSGLEEVSDVEEILRMAPIEELPTVEEYTDIEGIPNAGQGSARSRVQVKEKYLEVFLPSEFPMLDMENAVRNFGGIDNFSGILKESLHKLPPILEELKNPSVETLKDYGVKVHGLKGALYGICYDVGGKLAGELEKFANKGDIDAVLAHNDTFIAMISGFVQMLDETLNTGKTTEDAALLDKPDQNLLISLQEATEQYRIGEMEEIIQSLEKYRYRENPDLVPWLRKKIENLEYKDIVTKLASMENNYA
jgi:PAS domain S-box-containing protein